MAIFKYTISNSFANCEIEDELEIDDTFLKTLSEKERDSFIEEAVLDEVHNRIEWSFIEVEEDKELL